MIIGMGKSPISTLLQQYSSICAYPCFFDNKVLLTGDRNRAYIQYIKLLVRHYAKYGKVLKIAIWPDYTSLYKVEKIANIYLFNNIRFIVPIHDLSELSIADELRENCFRVFAGYASDKKLRNYDLADFKTVNYDLWYLGVSSKHEAREAVLNNFQGFDITTFLFGRHEDRKDSKKLVSNILNFVKEIKHQGRQTTLSEFVSVNWGVYSR
ncbi:hypothetical protein [Acidianus manzaensis]|uniref:Uncharacterized protein n=1 Tax=Acidianus manzaensis TaxID=282676 RepID=A0A1W6K0U3_9CREN|nr:hypothetical protein [Acidianus manzaensis]ARM76117.1 hypothetical protein B6F84_08835 [Acidianus manzaensis]